VSARAISAQIRRKLGPLTPAILEAVHQRALAGDRDAIIAAGALLGAVLRQA